MQNTQNKRYNLPPSPGGLFEAVRAIPADEAAQRLGLTLTRRGTRSWACCPIHGEKTPSLCFYPDGRYYCFGCHASGTTVDLYMAITGLTALDAAKQAAADFHLPTDFAPRPALPAKPSRQTLRLERTQRLERLRRLRGAAQRQLERFTGEDAWDDPEFLLALQLRAQTDELAGMMDACGEDALMQAITHDNRKRSDESEDVSEYGS